MSENFRVGEWLIEPQLNSISRGGDPVRLEPKVMEVLMCLAENAGEVVSKEGLIQKVWADRFVTDEVLTTSIFELRKALGDEARNPRFIRTIPKRGYQLIAQVSPVGVPSSVHEKPPSFTQPETSKIKSPESASPNRRWKFAAAAMIAMTLFALLLFKATGWWDADKDKTVAPKIESLAVLPLENLTGDPSQDYFADGMTEALINDLAKLNPLRVISRTSAMQYKNARKPLPDIARELGVDAVIEGSVSRANGRVRITAQLINALNDKHIWAESYERDLSDVLTLQSEVARAIAHEIELRLSLQEKTSRAATHQVNPEAYEFYLKGRQLINGETEQSLKEGLASFERAIQIDPGFALAHAGAAESHILLTEKNYLRPAEAYIKAKAAAIGALQIDDQIVEAHRSLAAVKIYNDRDWEGAEREFKRALELNPGDSRTHLWYGEYLWAANRMEEAIAEIKRAQELDPLSLQYRLIAGDLFLSLKMYDRAIEEYSKALALDPNNAIAHKGLWHCYDYKAMPVEAEAEYQKFKELSGTQQAPRIPPHLSRWAQKDDARSIIFAFSKVLNQKYVRPTHIARIYLDLGETDRAFDWLEKAYEERDNRLFYIKTQNGWDGVRNDPRFKDLERRIGLAR